MPVSEQWSARHERALVEGYEFCVPYTAGKHVLDVRWARGSGTAILRGCASITIVDADPAAIELGAAVQPSAFDAVLSVGGLPQIKLSDARKFMAEAWRALREEGMIILLVPSHKGTHCAPNQLFGYTASVLRAVAAPYFSEMRLEEFEGEVGPELRFVGRRRGAVAGGDEPDAALRDALQEMGRTMHEGTPQPQMKASPEADPLAARCAAIGLAWNEGSLDAQPAEQRRPWATEIRGLLSRDQLVSTGEADQLERLAMAGNALRLLGDNPPTLLPREFLDGEAIARWLEALDWKDPVKASSSVAALLTLLIHAREIEGERRAAEVYHLVLDWLDQRQNQATGLWGRGEDDPLTGVMAGARLIAFYQYVHRPMMCMRKMVDAALSIEATDVDRTYLLATAAFSTAYRNDEISRALIREFWRVWKEQSSCAGGRSDAPSAWRRLATMETVARACPADLPSSASWRPSPWPGTGYFPDGQSETDRGRWRAWMREPASGSSRFTANADVAVVITCFNLGEYLFESLDSVARQTLADITVIVYDDGSTDEFTRLYLEFLAERGFDVVRGQNGGLAAARNEAIARCQAKYICTLDADDRLHESYLENARRELESHPEAGFVSCYYRTFDNENAEYRYDKCRLPEMLVQNEAAVVSLFRREAWEKAGGYCRELEGMEDWDFWLSILETGYQSAVLPEILFHYRSRIGSMYSSTRKPATYVANMRIMMRRHRALFEANWEAVLELKTRQFAELLEVRSAELAAHERQLAAMQAASRAEVSRLNQLIEAMRRTKAWRAGEIVARMQKRLSGHWTTS